MESLARREKFFANQSQVQIKEQQRCNDYSIHQELAWYKHSPRLSQKSCFPGLSFHKRTKSSLPILLYLKLGGKLAKASWEILGYFNITMNITRETSRFQFFQKCFFSVRYFVVERFKQMLFNNIICLVQSTPLTFVQLNDVITFFLFILIS